jgi:hypothetical protein
VGFRFLLDSGLHVADAVTEARAARDVDHDDAAPWVTAEGWPGPLAVTTVVRNRDCEWQWQRARAAPEAATIGGGFRQVGRAAFPRDSRNPTFPSCASWGSGCSVVVPRASAHDGRPRLGRRAACLLKGPAQGTDRFVATSRTPPFNLKLSAARTGSGTFFWPLGAGQGLGLCAGNRGEYHDNH